jgi:type II secretory pathway pseudopilin PulG
MRSKFTYNASSRKAGTPLHPGFSLVEVMVASVILFTSVMAAVTLFNFTNINARLGEEKQDEQAAISEDLAAVVQINDKFRCTGDGTCSSGSNYPNENEYIPGEKSSLSGICNPDGTGSGFAPKLADTINNLAITPRLNELSISRSATIPETMNANNTPPHLSSVAWTKGSIVLRQITLTPTVASWCP